MDKEITYGDAFFLAPNRAQQEMMLNGHQVGFLSTYSANFLDDIHETWFVPDVEVGLEDGKWIEFRKFRDFCDMLEYLNNNLNEVAFLYEHGDWD